MIKTILNFLYLKTYVPTFLYKGGAIPVLSVGVGTLISSINLNDSYFGISLGLILVLSSLYLFDMFTGIVADRYLNGSKVESGKLAYTFYKFLGTFLFFWLIDSIQNKIGYKIIEHQNNEYMRYFYSSGKEVIEITSYSIYILLSLREWISIGENIEKRYNKKIYIFTIIEKIFDIIESKFIKYIADSSLCKNKDEKIEDK